MTTSRPLRTTALAALPAAALAAVHCVPVVSPFGPLRDRTMPRLSGRAHADHIALTFDDGPDPLSTPFFPRLLDERGVRATFFLLSSAAHRSPGVVSGIAAAGREIGVHGRLHRPLLRGPRPPYDRAGHTRMGPPHGDRGPRRRRHYPAARFGLHPGAWRSARSPTSSTPARSEATRSARSATTDSRCRTRAAGTPCGHLSSTAV
ncbi:polysaccharide deacetylase [Actinobacteria bacterium OK006]|nr:polysaccharide deacetylase [Actinobacteria bacterium OK006]